MEDPDRGRRLPQLDAPSGRSTRSIGWASVLDALADYAGTLPRSTPDPILGPPTPVGRPDRGGTERQCRPRLVRDRGRSPPDPRRRRRRGLRDVTRCSPNGCDGLERSNSASPGCTCRRWPPCGPMARTARATRSKRRPADGPAVRGVPFGTDAGPLSAARDALRRLRARRHRAGPHQGRMDRPRAGRTSPPRPITRSPSSWGSRADLDATIGRTGMSTTTWRRCSIL